jgi:hypothetical protein
VPFLLFQQSIFQPLHVVRAYRIIVVVNKSYPLTPCCRYFIMFLNSPAPFKAKPRSLLSVKMNM